MITSIFEKLNYSSRIKKHYCPKCSEQLKVLTVGNIVNTQPNSNRNKSFPITGSYMYGTMKSYSTEFHCPNCRLRYKPDDLRKIEQNNYKMKMS